MSCDLDLHIICSDLIEHWLNYDLMKGFLIFQLHKAFTMTPFFQGSANYSKMCDQYFFGVLAIFRRHNADKGLTGLFVS